MKHLLTIASVAVALAAPASAQTVDAIVRDHNKVVIEQTPYKVEVCRDVQVPYTTKRNFDQGGAIVGGIIGGVIGNQFGNGSGKEAMTGIGALTGAIVGGSNKEQTEYRWERQCALETRYEETEREVYSHSTITFVKNGQKYTLRFER